MFTQFFGNFLVNNGYITSAQLLKALKEKSSAKLKLGTLAINSGYMTSAQVEKVHTMQSQMDKRFGDIAVELGFITEEQVTSLLSTQKLDYLILGQVLIDNKILTNSDFEKAINSYKNEFSLEDNDFIEHTNKKEKELIKSYFNFNDSDSSKLEICYIELIIKNLIRFIGDDFSVCKIDTSEFNGDMIVSQSVVGKFETTSIITGDKQALIDFSKRYSGEKITELNEYVEASLSDFLNLHNGLFTVNISQNENIELTLTPPETNKIDSSIIKNSFTIKASYSFGDIKFAFTL